eukprot:5438699-Pyramimonas_sp.AAC.1
MRLPGAKKTEDKEDADNEEVEDEEADSDDGDHGGIQKWMPMPVCRSSPAQPMTNGSGEQKREDFS